MKYPIVFEMKGIKNIKNYNGYPIKIVDV